MRTAYALEQLASEIDALGFDGVEVTYGEPDGLDVIRQATFTKLPEWVSEAVNLEPDPRIAGSTYSKRSTTFEVQTTSPLADDRAPFNLAEAGAILSAPEA